MDRRDKAREKSWRLPRTHSKTALQSPAHNKLVNRAGPIRQAKPSQAKPSQAEPRLPEPPPPTHPDSFVNVPDYITLARAERLSAPLLPPPDLSAARTAAGAALEQQGGPEGRSYVAPSVPASYRRRRSLDGACF